jgi:ribonucleotide reductase alpha subunit
VDNNVSTLPSETLAAFHNDPLRARIFYEKYALRKSENDPVERVPEQMWKRVAQELAAVEAQGKRDEWEKKFLWLLSDFRFVPGGRILHAIGNPNKVTALNCFRAGTPVHTENGTFPIEILEGRHRVLSEGGLYREALFTCFGKQPLMAVTLENGDVFYATPGHHWIATSGSNATIVPTTRLKGRSVPLNMRPRPGKNEDFIEGVRHGIVYGDGSHASNHSKPPIHSSVRLFGPKIDLGQWFGDYPKNHHTYKDKPYLEVRNLPLKYKTIPEKVSPSYWYGFICGMIATDGFCTGRGTLGVDQSDENFLTLLREEVLPLIGMYASPPVKIRDKSPFDGSPRPCYRLLIFHDTVNAEDILRPDHRKNYADSRQTRHRVWIKVLDVQETGLQENVFCCVEPQTHTMTIGRGYLTRQCYVAPSPHDSIQGIYKTALELAETFKRGGGCGVDISSLRPKNSPAHNAARVSTGAVSFTELYSLTTGIIGQQGRRGALMLTISDSHPDVLDFCKVKRNQTSVRYANISVRVTDAFMKAVEHDDQWLLHYQNPEDRIEVKSLIRARELWQEIIGGARDWAEPGCLFWSTIQRYSSSDRYRGMEVVSTNPCLTGDTVIATPQGWRRLDSIEVGEEIYTVLGTGKVKRTEVYHDRPVYEIWFSDGGTLKATAAHQFHLREGDRYAPTRLDKIKPGDVIRTHKTSLGPVPGRQQNSSSATHVTKISFAGYDTVYDLYDPRSDTWIAEGYVCRGCGEEPLEPYGDCCIGSINLAAFINDSHTSNVKLDLVSLEKATRYAVRFLDNVLSWNEGRHPLRGQEEAALKGRRIGLGIMGLADMLCKLKLRYNSDEGIEFAERTVEGIKLWAYDESADIAAEKGPFPVFNAAKHLHNPFFKDFPHELIEKIENKGLRNVTLLTIPPTGSIAAMAGVTSGIEPIFDIKYVRRSESLSESVFEVQHPLVAEYKKTNESREKDPLPAYFVTAHEIAPEKRVLIQAALQRHIDQAISSTINLSKDTPVETIERIYRMAWEQGLKGITVYREGSREGILLTEKQAKRQAVKVVPAKVTPRPVALNGVTARERTPLGTAFVTINYANGNPKEPFEVFVRLGKAGSDLEADAEALGRLLSLILRLPSPMTRENRLREVIDQLEDIGGSRSTGFGPERVRSMPDAIARALSRWLETVNAREAGLSLRAEENAISPNGNLLHAATTGDFCPRCRQASLITQQGCLRCADCGYKEC